MSLIMDFFAVVIYLAWNYAVPVLLPFIFAFCITLFLRSPADWLSEKLHCRSKKKWVAVILLILLYLIFFGAIFWAAGRPCRRSLILLRTCRSFTGRRSSRFSTGSPGRSETFWRIRTLLWPWRYRTVFQQFTMNMGEHLSFVVSEYCDGAVGVLSREYRRWW